MDIRDIVKAGLEAKGFDGLYNDDNGEPCGCPKDDLSPCGDLNWGGCLAGYNDPETAKKQGCDFWITPIKPKVYCPKCEREIKCITELSDHYECFDSQQLPTKGKE